MYLVMLTLLALSVSHGTLNYGKTEKELVKEEALNICRPFEWPGFFRVLALPSVCLCFAIIKAMILC